RDGKRQAAPFAKGPPQPEPKRPGRKPGPHYGPKARRQPPAHIDEIHEAPLPDTCPGCGGPARRPLTLPLRANETSSNRPRAPPPGPTLTLPQEGRGSPPPAFVGGASFVGGAWCPSSATITRSVLPWLSSPPRPGSWAR